MKKNSNITLIYSPKPDITVQEMADILRLFVFMAYPPQLKTNENFHEIFDHLSDGAKRHFKLK